MSANLPTLYQDFIHLSRYARWLDQSKRRETWGETVDRYIDFMCHKCKVSKRIRTELKEAIINLEVMPSMRAMMTAGKALERDAVAGYNCFSGSEPFYTMDGMTTLSEACGTTQNVLTRGGTWERAEVRSFGVQALQLVTLKPCTSPNAKTNVRHMVKVTRDHRWITSNRGEVTDLKVGDLIPFQGQTGITVTPEGMPGLDYDLEAWIAGFGFGDGTIDSRGRAKVRLCGDKDKQWLPLFERRGNNCVMYPPSYNGDAVVLFRQGYFSDWKKLPSRNESSSYLASWLEGYLAADGHRDEHEPGLSSQDDEAIRFVMDIAPLAGYLVTGHNTSSIMETNLGTRKSPLQKLTLRKEGMFRVQSVEELGEDEVFCVTEPKTGTFTLRNGVLTGNCSYLAIDHISAFDELLYILMCGAGVGFTVERQVIKEATMPAVASSVRPSKTTIRVEDSKLGWANAFRELISMLYQGRVPEWDVSEVRPSGARLKTFGGRASGPEPLEDLFRFAIGMFTDAAGRRLTSIECHDLCCKIGEVVVVGGVRRSALISLSNPSDDRMRHAKSGDWRELTPWRRLANNSACYTEKPGMDSYMREWLALYDSKSGERGIFNRVAAQNQAKKFGRRDPNWAFGCNPCSEIFLRPDEFCNLTEVVVRKGDSVRTLERKIRLATILGTMQATLTHFRYLRPTWKQNTEDERLLGVSLTGVMDHELLNGSKGNGDLSETLERLRAYAVKTNKEWARKLDIAQAAAVTCNKPSGTVSQLVDCASGIHSRHSPYWLRNVRADKKDPLAQMMASIGFPHEDDVTKPEHNLVFPFPIKAPAGAVTSADQSALAQLKTWKTYQDHWCEHKPSCTVTVKESEWMGVGSWVYDNFDQVSGISFLPAAGHVYKQTPYQECTKREFDEAQKKMPKNVDWSGLDAFEVDDSSVNYGELACSGPDGCELVDIVKG